MKYIFHKGITIILRSVMVVGLFNGIAICDKCKRIYCIKYQINIIVDPILLH